MHGRGRVVRSHSVLLSREEDQYIYKINTSLQRTTNLHTITKTIITNQPVELSLSPLHQHFIHSFRSQDFFTTAYSHSYLSNYLISRHWKAPERHATQESELQTKTAAPTNAEKEAKEEGKHAEGQPSFLDANGKSAASYCSLHPVTDNFGPFPSSSFPDTSLFGCVHWCTNRNCQPICGAQCGLDQSLL